MLNVESAGRPEQGIVPHANVAITEFTPGRALRDERSGRSASEGPEPQSVEQRHKGPNASAIARSRGDHQPICLHS